MKPFNLRVLAFLSLGHLTVDVYQGALPAILPFLKEHLALDYTMTGFILVVANFASSILQPLFGLFSDKKERPFLLPLGIMAAGMGFSLLSLPSHYPAVLALVAVSGLGIASFHVEGYKRAAFFTGDRPATGMSVFSVGGNLGFALGLMIALWTVSRFGFPSLPLVATLALIYTAVYIGLRKVVACPATTAARGQSGHPTGQAAAKGAYAALCLIICVVILRSWIQLGLVAYIPFYFIGFLKGNPVYAGKLVSTFLLGGALGTLVGAPIADRWGHTFEVRMSMLLTALGFPLIFLVKGELLFVVLFILGGVLVSSFSVTIVMAQRLLPRNIGMASGLMTGFAIGAGGVGVTLLGVVADRSGVDIALKSIGILPVAAFALGLIVKSSPGQGAPA
jgi:FSR family fosmidomycin resistance protein-like MFS transporter